mmetsp:Transcript_30177/g.79262  ORF Transcript_30177/g.79262 Transcript_30177/m.79262 type:complete len:186 (+) Transcript_30177:48-605(+)
MWEDVLQAVGNPINVVLLLAIGYLVWVILSPPTHYLPEQPPAPPLNIPNRDYTPEDMARFNGVNAIEEHNGRKTILLACGGVVFDVTSGRDFYGPGGPYAVFAGRDASRGLATMSLAPPAEGWDDLSDLQQEEQETFAEWCQMFADKYPVRGKLVRGPIEGDEVGAEPQPNEPKAEAEGIRKRRV